MEIKVIMGLPADAFVSLCCWTSFIFATLLVRTLCRFSWGLLSSKFPFFKRFDSPSTHSKLLWQTRTYGFMQSGTVLALSPFVSAFYNHTTDPMLAIYTGCSFLVMGAFTVWCAIQYRRFHMSNGELPKEITKSCTFFLLLAAFIMLAAFNSHVGLHDEVISILTTTAILLTIAILSEKCFLPVLCGKANHMNQLSCTHIVLSISIWMLTWVLAKEIC